MTTGKVKSYVYALGKVIAKVDGVIGDTIAKKYWYHADHVGSVKAVTNQAGAVVWNADYLPFGKQYIKNKIDPEFEEDDLGFTGKGFDADVGLYYFNARWYDADTGRFISEDPVGDPSNPNLYTYGRNNPLKFIDPTGLTSSPSDVGNPGHVGYDNGGSSVIPCPVGGPPKITYGPDNSKTYIDEHGHTIVPWGYLLDGVPIPTFSNVGAYLEYFRNLNVESLDGWGLQMALATMWVGINKFGNVLMPKKGWGIPSDQAGAPNHTDVAFMNMVSVIQTVLGGIKVDGKFGSQTQNRITQLYGKYSKDNRLGFKGDIVGQRLLGRLIYRVYYSALNSFIWSTTGRISSGFGWRVAPKDGATSNHAGLDIGNAIGTDILASATGTVIESGFKELEGYYVKIDHGNGITTAYCHLNSLSHLRVGQDIAQGELVGLMGSTGVSTGSHLHFGIRSNGVAVNPMNYLSYNPNMPTGSDVGYNADMGYYNK